LNRVNSVMIVDDNPGDVLLLRLCLEESGLYEHILEARNGAEALERFTRHQASRKAEPDARPPLVIFLDINMPLMDGWEFLERLAALIQTSTGLDESSVAVIMLSSSTETSDSVRAKENPLVHDFLVKPTTLECVSRIADQFGS